MQNLLELNDNDFNTKLVDWAIDFGFKIDKDVLIFERKLVNEWVDKLDKEFETWNKKSYKKNNIK